MPFNETEEGKTHSFNDGCNPPHEMPTTPHEEPTKSESVEEIVEKFEKKFVYYTPTGNMLLNDIAASVDNGMNAFLASSLTTAYTAGRSSMRQDVLAVGKNAKTGWYEAGEGLDIEYSAEEMRSELLTNIKNLN